MRATKSKKWEIINKRTAFKNKWRQIDEWQMRLPDGSEEPYFFNVNNDIVIILALKENGKLVLNNQYYIHCSKRVLTLPAGYVEKGGQPLATAKRELREETGYVSAQWKKLGWAYIGKWSTNKIHYFLALDAEQKFAQDLEPSEDIVLVFKTVRELKKLILEGKVHDELLLSGLAMLSSHFI